MLIQRFRRCDDFLAQVGLQATAHAWHFGHPHRSRHLRMVPMVLVHLPSLKKKVVLSCAAAKVGKLILGLVLFFEVPIVEEAHLLKRQGAAALHIQRSEERGGVAVEAVDAAGTPEFLHRRLT
jgi:hypothetical protein